MSSNSSDRALQLQGAYQFKGRQPFRRETPGLPLAKATYLIPDSQLSCSVRGGRDHSPHVHLLRLLCLALRGALPPQVTVPSQLLLALSLSPPCADLPVPNKSVLLFLLFLLTLSRVLLRPFLSDNEPGTRSSSAVRGPGQDGSEATQSRPRVLSHCADFPLAGPITAIALLCDG